MRLWRIARTVFVPIVVLVGATLLAAPIGRAAGPADVLDLAEPAVSPDHTRIAFVRGGDVWSVPAAGGSAQLLVAASGAATRPIFSPDGKRLAFVNVRAGETGVYIVTLDGGAMTRLTHDDVAPELDGWSADGDDVYFTTNVHNIGYDGDIMRVRATGGTPLRVVGERFVNAMEAAPSPDGRTIAYVRNGFVQWWRRGHSHMDEDEIVLAQPAAQRFETLTHGEAKDRWPMWSPDGATLYFVSDRSGSDELWSRAADGRLKRLTELSAEPVLWPTISHDGRMIAFEHAFAIWTYDIATGSTRRVPIGLEGGQTANGPQHVVQTNRLSSLDLSPDGKKLAFVASARVFVAASGDVDAPAQLVTRNAGAAYDLPVWSKDSRRIAYVVDRGRATAIAVAELPDGAEQIITPAGQYDDYPHWSPDGTRLAYVRDGRELHVLDVGNHSDSIVARGFLDRRPFGDAGDIAFSPAGDWLAYIDLESGFSNVRVVRTSGGETHAVSFLPNASAGPLAWSTDGMRLFFVTSQRTENGQVAQVDLEPRAPEFREDALRRLFDPEPELPSRNVASPAPGTAPRVRAAPSAAARPSTTSIDFTAIRERLSMLPTGLDVSRIATTPDGKTLVLVATAASEQNLYAFSIDDTSSEPPVARQLSSTDGEKSGVAVSPDGKTIFYLDAGAVWSVSLDGTKAKRSPIAVDLRTDFAADRPLVFAQTWSLLDRWYADPHFHGADWNAVERIYAPHAAAAQTPVELRRVISLMLGELNSSHLGIRGPGVAGVPRFTTGRLGVQWATGTDVQSGALRVAEVAPLGPLALAGGAAGDDVLAIDGRPIAAGVDIDELLADKIGKRTILRLAAHGNAAAARSVAVLPIDTPAEQALWYRGWVEARRRYVERISGGRLGYVHLLDMSEAALTRFSTDLDVQNRAKAGVVVDIRNNEGGFVDPYAIDVLTRREYARFASRFGSDPPERTSLGQRTLDKPSALVVNEHSLSDAENFTEAYRALHAGPVIGEPTAGWIIFTSAATLADGSTLRLPATRVYGQDGVDMELHPRPVDIRVDNPPGATDRGDDPQLDAAVKALLHRVDRG